MQKSVKWDGWISVFYFVRSYGRRLWKMFCILSYEQKRRIGFILFPLSLLVMTVCCFLTRVSVNIGSVCGDWYDGRIYITCEIIDYIVKNQTSVFWLLELVMLSCELPAHISII